MKRKIIAICVAFTAMATTNGFALEVYKGKITQHKEWSTGKIKAIFKEANKSDAKSKLKDNSVGYTWLNLKTAHGLVGKPISLQGETGTYYRNTTDKTQAITYRNNICVEVTENVLECSYYYDNVELEAGGEIRSNMTAQLPMTFDHSGEFNMSAHSYVDNTGESSFAGVETNSKVFIAENNKQ